MSKKKGNKENKENKENKDCMVQFRCEKKGYKLLKKLASMNGMKYSEYLRCAVFGGNGGKVKNIQFALKAQELLNYLEDNCAVADNKLEKKVDELWKSLL